MMSGRFRKVFFAFPKEPPELYDGIMTATTASSPSWDNVVVTSWPQIEIFGAALADEVRSRIRESDVLACDITYPNYNVYYEIGYAIGCGKSIAPVMNTSFANAKRNINQDGIFDGIGYRTYENSGQLVNILNHLPDHVLVDLYSKSINFEQPLFLMDTLRKTDFRNAIVSSVKRSKVFYRSFDPAEVPRFSVISIITEVTSSAGTIVPLLSENIDDSSRHNLRAAILSGISQGLGRPTLLMQRDFNVVPADYKEFVISISDENSIDNLVVSFSREAIVEAQSIRSAARQKVRKNALQQLTLGSSSAENEFRTLELYFVETAEYLRTIRGETRIVAGRKGSGKTAIFFRVRDNFRSVRGSFVTDLKPESHQLSLFRQELLKVSNVGIFDHTLASFWYFVILSEILLNMRMEFDHRSKRDTSALQVAHEIDAVLDKFGIFERGDFTSRINKLGVIVLDEIKSLQARGLALSPERLTNIVFRDGVIKIRDLIDRYTTTGDTVVFLFDNIDKGWLSHGVNEFDVRLVRLLIEMLDKVRQDLNVRGIDFISVVFLRNDIHELLVDQTPDRNKAGQIRIDWTDRAKLRQVIFRRLAASASGIGEGFEILWSRFFVSDVTGKNSFEYFLDHCLMRPRFLLNIIENAIANAINRGHETVQEHDCIDAVRQHSLYLVSDFGYEIRDVAGFPHDILYSLVGSSQIVTKDEVLVRFRQFGVAQGDLNRLFYLMLWYGVIGIAVGTNDSRFIYDYEYDIRRLEAEIRKSGDEALYVINNALHVALID